MSNRRIYPEEVVAMVRRLYVDEGMTREEVQAAMPGYRVKTIIDNHQIPMRPRSQWRGSRSGQNNGKWAGDAVTYEGAHLRLRSIRGRARDFSCVDCGEPAQEWSYNHDDPNEKRMPDGTRPYSGDPSHYSPRCLHCHRKMDRSRNLKTHCIRGHEFTPENTRLEGTKRRCRACIRIRSAAARQARSARTGGAS